MCTSMTCTVRSFASGANSWDSFGGRFELNVAAAAKQYTSLIRLSQCHKAFSLLDEMLSQRLMPDGITYNAAISACEKGQKPQQALHLLQELQLRGLLPDVITYSAAISACEKGQKP